jgi:hypothetical protein
VKATKHPPTSSNKVLVCGWRYGQVGNFQLSSPVASLGSSSTNTILRFARVKDMSLAMSFRRMLPSMRQDYIRRHRMTRRITNVVLVVILSALAGYFITVQPKQAYSGPEKNSGAVKGDAR